MITISKIKLPIDIHLYGERDFTFLTSYMMLRLFVNGIARYLGGEYEMCAIIYKGNKMVFYRSESDEAAFSKYVGEQCLEKASHAKHISDKLRELTDSLDTFISEHKSFTVSNFSRFLELFDEHFAYHLAVFWAYDHIGRIGGPIDSKEILSLLDDARTYNERIIPKVDDWIRKQGGAQFMTIEEIKDSFVGKAVNPEELRDRKKCSFIIGDKKSLYLSSGHKAEVDAEKVESFALERVSKLVNEKKIEGLPVFSGIYKGKARVIKDFDKFSALKKGEVLVAPMTRPHFNSLIRGAGAIVTDEGAVLCHAAIIARELKIPCIVGTKVATTVLKDGDMIEVDAEKGIVKILND